MNAVAMLIALLVERFFDCSHLRFWSGYFSYQQWVTKRFAHLTPYAILALTIVPILFAVMIVMWIIHPIFYGFISFLFSVFAILYCFGPRNWWADMAACQHALSAGESHKVIDQLYAVFDATFPNDTADLRHQGLETILVVFNRRVFANLFWFGLLGVSGMVGYRLITLSAGQALSGNKETNKQALQIGEAASRVEAYLNWPSVRILTLIFAFRKQFHRVLTCWQSSAMSGVDANGILLQECGAVALSEQTQAPLKPEGLLENVIHLLDRSLAIFFIIIAVWIFLVSY